MRHLLLVLAALAAPAQAQDAAAGGQIYGDVCKNCHGPTGKGMASFPKLIGHDAAFLTERLETYRAGERIGPNSPLMYGPAEELTDDDIANIVAFITGDLG